MASGKGDSAFFGALKHEKLLSTNPTPMHIHISSSMHSRLYKRKNTGSWDGKVVGGIGEEL